LEASEGFLTVIGVQGKSCGAASQAIVNKCVRVKQGALVDDTTCLVIDCRPYNVPTFKGYHPEKEKNNGSIMHSRSKRVRYPCGLN